MLVGRAARCATATSKLTACAGEHISSASEQRRWAYGQRARCAGTGLVHGRMDDESRACQEQQHTFSQCLLSHGVLLVALAEVTGKDQVTCKLVGVSAGSAQMDSNDV